MVYMKAADDRYPQRRELLCQENLNWFGETLLDFLYVFPEN